MAAVTVHVDPTLRFLLTPARRRGPFTVRAASTDTVGHVVRSVGIPLTEVGALHLDGAGCPADRDLPGTEHRLEVGPVDRPEPTATSPPRFLLDVHLASLGRRLRLLGLDAAGTERDPGDAALVTRATEEGRVLLTQDRGLLHRRALGQGALVRGAGTDQQLHDVLDRFAPALAPWTRCVACGGPLHRTTAREVSDEVQPGTLRTYTEFSRCAACRRVYWRGAHAARLDAVVGEARAIVAHRRR